MNTSPEGITQSYADKVDMRTKGSKDKWANKEEIRTAEMVWRRFDVMRDFMEGTCPFIWEAGTEGEETEMVGGQGSWFDYLDRCEEQWSMIRLYDDGDMDFRSPIVFSPIEAIMADFQKAEITAMIEPAEYREDTAKAKLLQYAENHLYNKKSTQIRRTDKETFHSSLKFGWSIRYVGWFDQSRELEIQVEKVMEGDEKKKKKNKEILDSGKPVTEKQTKTDHNDIGHIWVSNYDFYPDPDAKYMRGLMDEMSDCIWLNSPSVEGALAEFRDSKDPYVIKDNVEKIVSAANASRGYDSDKNEPFFDPTPSKDQETQVVLLRYYNKRTDKYIVLANDVVVRDGPIPYNFKQLPFVMHKLINWEGHLFGIGLPAALEALQSSDETLTGLMMRQLGINIAPPMIYNKKLAEDLEAWERYEPGQQIGFSGPVTENDLRWMPQSQARFDYFNMKSELRLNTTLAAGIDSLASASPNPSSAVRTNMMSMEATQKIIAKHLDNWGDAREEAVWMDLRLMQQFYPKSYTEELDDKGKKSIKYKIIKTKENIEIKEGKDGLAIENVDGSKGFFEMKGEYLELMGDVDIKLNLDQVLAPSKAMQAQNSKDLLGALVPIYSKPEILEAPGMNELVRWVCETHGAPPNVTDMLQNSSSEQDIDIARQQNEMISEGRVVSGHPGESIRHIQEHTVLIEDLYQARKEDEDKMAKLQVAPENMTPEKMRKTADELEKINIITQKIDRIISDLMEHIKVDRIPKYAAAEALEARQQQAGGMVQGMMPQAPQMAPGAIPGPQMGGMPPQGPQGVAPQMPQGMPQGIPGGVPQGIM